MGNPDVNPFAPKLNPSWMDYPCPERQSKITIKGNEEESLLQAHGRGCRSESVYAGQHQQDDLLLLHDSGGGVQDRRDDWAVDSWCAAAEPDVCKTIGDAMTEGRITTCPPY